MYLPIRWMAITSKICWYLVTVWCDNPHLQPVTIFPRLPPVTIFSRLPPVTIFPRLPPVTIFPALSSSYRSHTPYTGYSFFPSLATSNHIFFDFVPGNLFWLNFRLRTQWVAVLPLWFCFSKYNRSLLCFLLACLQVRVKVSKETKDLCPISLWRRANARNVSFILITVANLHFQLSWYNQITCLQVSLFNNCTRGFYYTRKSRANNLIVYSIILHIFISQGPYERLPRYWLGYCL